MNRNNYYGFKNGNYLRTYDDIGTAKLEHDVNRHVTVRDQVRYANYVRDARITEPQLVAPVTLATPLSAIMVNRNEIRVDSVETYLDEQLDVTARFNTGFDQPQHDQRDRGSAARLRIRPARNILTSPRPAFSIPIRISSSPARPQFRHR